MTQTEYENKKAECWEEFKKLDRKSTDFLREVNASSPAEYRLTRRI